MTRMPRARGTTLETGVKPIAQRDEEALVSATAIKLAMMMVCLVAVLHALWRQKRRDLRRAREAGLSLEEYHARIRGLPAVQTPLRCVRCGYDLRGSLDSALCPECGTDNMAACAPDRFGKREGCIALGLLAAAGLLAGVELQINGSVYWVPWVCAQVLVLWLRIALRDTASRSERVPLVLAAAANVGPMLTLAWLAIYRITVESPAYVQGGDLVAGLWLLLGLLNLLSVPVAFSALLLPPYPMRRWRSWLCRLAVTVAACFAVHGAFAACFERVYF